MYDLSDSKVLKWTVKKMKERKNRNEENVWIRTRSWFSIGKHSLIFVNWQRNCGDFGGVLASLDKSLM